MQNELVVFFFNSFYIGYDKYTVFAVFCLQKLNTCESLWPPTATH